MTRLERLRKRQLPCEVVTLPPAVEGDEPERFELQALLPEQWDDLVLAHPPTEAQREQGAGLNVVTFRPALLAASVITPPGEEPLTVKDWEELLVGGFLSAGEANALYNTAYLLNDRSPLVTVGKD